MKPETIPSLDALAAEPARVATLTRDIRQTLIQKCAALCLTLADGAQTPVAAADRLLGAAEAAIRMGKTVGWMKTQGRSLPFARKVGRSWGWVESGIAPYLRRERWPIGARG